MSNSGSPSAEPGVYLKEKIFEGRSKPMFRKLGIIFLLFLLSGSLLSCATVKTEGSTSASGQKSRASYYDFADILIPSELTIDKKHSFVYSTSQLKVGILTFKGRVESDSLAAFFHNNMLKDGWRVICTLKYGETMIVFRKEDVACVITINENLFITVLEVRVGPVEQASSQVKESR